LDNDWVYVSWGFCLLNERERVSIWVKMNATDLAQSVIDGTQPPVGLGSVGECLWYARAGKWDKAHDLCQDLPGKAGSWIHAWLHRQEGDLGNAGYWYARAGKVMPGKQISMEDEWMAIAAELLG
jgi:hypothetical protein